MTADGRDEGATPDGETRSPIADDESTRSRMAGDGGTPSPMAEDGGTQAAPEYEVEQYLPGIGETSAERYQLLREKFGYVRAYYKTRGDKHADLQRWLNQSRSGRTYDDYLTSVTRYALIVGLLMGLVGILSAWALTQVNAFDGLSQQFGFVPYDVAVFVDTYQILFATLLFGVVGGGIFAGASWLLGYYYPYFEADSRRRNINVMLPHGIVYMYALSFGGMNIVEIISKIADAEGTYGEVANEFDMIQRDLDVFGNDLFTALRNARNLTPSENFEDFLDDLIRTMDSGGDVTRFLENETEKYMERAKDEQESFLETLATLSEIFVVAFVAAPLFLIVVLMVMSFLGGQTVPQLFAVVYLLLPLGMGLFLTLVSTISEPYTPPEHQIEMEEYATASEDPSAVLEAYEPYQEFERIQRRQAIESKLSDPLAVFRKKPVYAFAMTVPAAIVTAVLGAQLVQGPLTLDTLLNDPVGVTLVLGVAPFLVLTAPVSAFHEYKRYREKDVSKRFPDVLNVLSSANQMGIQLTEGLELVAKESTGVLATELQRVSNDIQWNYDTRRALLSLADRLTVPQVTRSCKIISEGSRSSGDLYRILSTAAEDTRHRFRIERRRRQEMNTYTTIAVIGFFVYLAVIVIMNTSFLAPIEEVAREAENLEQAGPLSLTAVSVDTYRAIFFHSALIQGVGSGLIAGKLSDNDVMSGLKYAIALVVLSMAVFIIL